jgi:hypothetical protein
VSGRKDHGFARLAMDRSRLGYMSGYASTETIFRPSVGGERLKEFLGLGLQDFPLLLWSRRAVELSEEPALEPICIGLALSLSVTSTKS